MNVYFSLSKILLNDFQLPPIDQILLSWDNNMLTAIVTKKQRGFCNMSN